jgi:hypothetical protein
MALIVLLVAKIQLLAKALDTPLPGLISGINARLVGHTLQIPEQLFLMPNLNIYHEADPRNSTQLICGIMLLLSLYKVVYAIARRSRVYCYA